LKKAKKKKKKKTQNALSFFKALKQLKKKGAQNNCIFVVFIISTYGMCLAMQYFNKASNVFLSQPFMSTYAIPFHGS
jgi:hypothetical protein